MKTIRNIEENGKVTITIEDYNILKEALEFQNKYKGQKDTLYMKYFRSKLYTEIEEYYRHTLKGINYNNKNTIANLSIREDQLKNRIDYLNIELESYKSRYTRSSIVYFIITVIIILAYIL